jgi:hypothetical protein
MITESRKEFLRKLDEENHYHLETFPDEVRFILSNGIYNSIPRNIATIVTCILKRFPGAQLTVGNEGSRVLYVRLFASDMDKSTFVSIMEMLAIAFEADEHDLHNGFFLKYRFWWD